MRNAIRLTIAVALIAIAAILGILTATAGVYDGRTILAIAALVAAFFLYLSTFPNGRTK